MKQSSNDPATGKRGNLKPRREEVEQIKDGTYYAGTIEGDHLIIEVSDAGIEWSIHGGGDDPWWGCSGDVRLEAGVPVLEEPSIVGGSSFDPSTIEGMPIWPLKVRLPDSLR